MDEASLIAALAFATALPALWFAWRLPDASRTPAFALGAAALGPLGFVGWFLRNGWLPTLSATLWVSMTAGLVSAALLAWIAPSSRRLLPLSLGYLLVGAVLAWLGHLAERADVALLPWTPWVGVHVAVSVATYSLLSLGAVAGFAVLLQQRALRRKKPSSLSRRLPSIADGSRLQFRLLLAAESVLGLSLVAGILVRATEGLPIWAMDHKTLLSIACFLILGLLLILQFRDGLRGGVVARTILVGYVLLTLAFPGVKLVTEIILATVQGGALDVTFV